MMRYLMFASPFLLMSETTKLIKLYKKKKTKSEVYVESKVRKIHHILSNYKHINKKYGRLTRL